MIKLNSISVALVAFGILVGCDTVSVRDSNGVREVPVKNLGNALAQNYVGAAKAIVGTIIGNDRIQQQGVNMVARSVELLGPTQFERRVASTKNRRIRGSIISTSGARIDLPDTDCRFDLDTGEAFCLSVENLQGSVL